ncbi:hypothetical protein SAMN05421831_11419 [Allopseudospirillum japonicum]|uniref:Sulfotransferase domain-containing protein n=1 Tax=Allopseudospirillum japonicum TaxID=64971 RepID=A0A1H6UF89_9GAMM|nr:hypothetical protein [Allopseudospirillum japonicum]SEI86805.1 hypothetical protein SAMN05421831_11419 [Allopseudospirillum japonicum]
MKNNFIHIGLMKTGTTYMQNVWFQSKDHCLCWRGMEDFIYFIRDKTIGLDRDPNEVQIRFDNASVDGQSVVVSHESLSTAYLNEPENSYFIRPYIDETAYLLSLLKISETILIVVRDPLSWIRSIYSQSIKQGGYTDAQDFVNQQSMFIQSSLDIKYLCDAYSRHFAKIIILPFELMKDDLHGFWKILSKHTGCEIPEERLIYGFKKLNTKLTNLQIQILAHLNKRRHLTHQLSKKYSGPEAALESAIISDKKNNLLVCRRLTENMPKGKELEFASKLDINLEPQKDFYQFKLSHQLKSNIQQNMINYLESSNYIPEELKSYISRYQV